MLLFKYINAHGLQLVLLWHLKKKKLKNKKFFVISPCRSGTKQPSCIPFYLWHLLTKREFKKKERKIVAPFFLPDTHALQCVKTIPPALQYISLSLIFLFFSILALTFLKKVKTHISDILCVLLLSIFICLLQDGDVLHIRNKIGRAHV